MLENFQPVPPDPILGLGQLYAADPREGKIDLGVGVFKDADGNTPIMAAVKKAEVVLHDMQTTKTYKPLGGDEAFRDAMREMVLGDSVAADRVATIQTPGGSGAIASPAPSVASAAGSGRSARHLASPQSTTSVSP